MCVAMVNIYSRQVTNETIGVKGCLDNMYLMTFSSAPGQYSPIFIETLKVLSITEL